MGRISSCNRLTINLEIDGRKIAREIRNGREFEVVNSWNWHREDPWWDVHSSTCIETCQIKRDDATRTPTGKGGISLHIEVGTLRLNINIPNQFLGNYNNFFKLFGIISSFQCWLFLYINCYHFIFSSLIEWSYKPIPSQKKIYETNLIVLNVNKFEGCILIF